MLTKKDKQEILKILKKVDVRKMSIDHQNEDIVKWFRFGNYNAMSIVADIIKELPEQEEPKKKVKKIVVT